MPAEDKGDIVAIFAFAIFFVLCGWAVYVTNNVPQLFLLTFLDFTIIVLATFRFTHMLTFDKVLVFARHWFMVESAGTYEPPTRGVKKLMYGLLECLWCTGMWSGVLIVTLYLVSVWSRLFVLMLAAAGAGSFLQVISLAISRVREEP
jgi:hypothetical protein